MMRGTISSSPVLVLCYTILWQHYFVDSFPLYQHASRKISSSRIHQPAPNQQFNVARLPFVERLDEPVVVHREISAPATDNNNDTPNFTPPRIAWDDWWLEHMDQWYSEALAIKCPFLRRRVTDVLDAMDGALRHVLLHDPTRMGPPLAYRCKGDTCDKELGLSLLELCTELQKDWRTDTMKGYYITGKVNTALYRDDCLFDGPDPDMPVRGLRKYLNAASQLFDPSKSTSELLSLRVEENVVVARWRIRGYLRLPWRPRLPTVTGKTVYHTDLNGLIQLHEEMWDISVWRAFLTTFFPDVAGHIWDEED